jgi:hypothetical protein
MPAGFVPNTNPLCPSWYVSRIIWKLSVSFSDESRRESATMMPAGLLSYSTTPTYSVSCV